MSQRLLFAVTLAVAMVFGSASVTTAGENYAFLVGVGGYDEKHLTPLKYSRNDILALEKTLTETGFERRNVLVMHDDLEQLVARYKSLGPQYKARDYVPEADKIRTELKLFLSLPQPEDAVVVAFAGHGVQFKGEEQVYFCPVDADLDDLDRRKLIRVDEVYAALRECPARRKLLLVDACRNDPQSRLSRRTDTIQLETISLPQLTPPPEGVVALFSCAPGQQAFEYPDLNHGVFFYHVLQAWQGRGDGNGDRQVSLDELISYAKTETGQFARVYLKAVQTPRQLGFFDGEWILGGPAVAAPNLLVNGGFESDYRNWGTGTFELSERGRSLNLPPYWTGQVGNVITDASAAIDHERVHSGRAALRIDHRQAFGPHLYGTISQQVRGLKPNTVYRLSGWSRGARLVITPDAGWSNRIAATAGDAWQEFHMDYDTGATDFIDFRILSETPGTSWIDDLSLTEVRSK